MRDFGPRRYFITAAAAVLTETLTQKPLREGGSVDSSGIIRINAGTWNKEMSHHNTDQLFISILCLARWISRVIMARRGAAADVCDVDGYVHRAAEQ